MVCIIHMKNSTQTAEFYRKENRNITAKIKITGFTTRTSKSADLQTSVWLQKSLLKTAHFHSNLTSQQLFHSIKKSINGKKQEVLLTTLHLQLPYLGYTYNSKGHQELKARQFHFFKVDIFSVKQKQLNRNNFYFSRNRLYFPSLFQKIRTKFRKFLIC